MRAQAASPAAAKKAILIVVSKTQGAEAIIPLLKAGQRDFGENRVAEASEKWPVLREQYPDIRLHLIGPLQTNKVKDALFLFDVIHTIDRESLVDALVKQRGADSLRTKEFFAQVNTGEEPQKAGAVPKEIGALLNYCRTRELPITGLMCIPPADELPAPHFALLRTLADKAGLGNLSMGMSGDYETALRLGATHVRVGSAIFGER